MVYTLGPSSQAYGLFFAELAGHIERTESVLSGRKALSPEICVELAAGFHKVKGGAGFFGLEDIRALAASLEGHFLQGADSGVPAPETSGTFDRLRQSSAGIPRPQKKEES